MSYRQTSLKLRPFSRTPEYFFVSRRSLCRHGADAEPPVPPASYFLKILRIFKTILDNDTIALSVVRPNLGVLERMKFFSWLPFFKKPRLSWWVVIQTTIPRCTYYFGPFDSAEEAKLNQTGYVEDLREEGAQGLSIKIEQCEPEVLTVDEEERELRG